MRIATWNVNSIRARVDLVTDWLRRVEPDVLCLQETKVVDDDFPTDEFQRLGYGVALSGQPTYNGVAIASRHLMRKLELELPGDPTDTDRRFLGATICGVRIISAYVPNGRDVADPHFQYKLRWLERLRAAIAPGDGGRPSKLVVCGDFNVARDERDVYDPEAYRGRVHFHPDERATLDRLLEAGLRDAFRLHEDDSGHYSWWDYRGGSFQRNEGLRIDYVFLSDDLADQCAAAYIDREERGRDRPSDHVPVVVDVG